MKRERCIIMQIAGLSDLVGLSTTTMVVNVGKM
jgi:hypothetical protein